MIPPQIRQFMGSTKSWFIQHAVCTLNTVSVPVIAFCKPLDEIALGWGSKGVLILIEGNSEEIYWICDEDDHCAKGKDIEEHPGKARKLFKEWKGSSKRLLKFCRGLHETDSDFIGKYPEFLDLYIAEYSKGMICDYDVVWSNKVMARIYAKYPNNKKEAEILIQPDFLTYTMEEEKGLLQIKKRFAKAIPRDFKDCPEGLLKALTKHAEKFFWIENGYKYVKILDAGYFFNKLKGLKEYDKKLNELEDYEKSITQKKIYAEKKFSKQDSDSLRLLGLIGWWHDQRKMNNLIALHYHHMFIREVAKQRKTDAELLHYYTALEFKDISRGKQIDKAELEKRRKGLAFFVLKNGFSWVGTGKDYESIRKTLNERRIEDAGEISGLCAFPGTVKGKVKVILNPHKQALKPGEILVTFMTRPEFIVIMKNAAAVLTEEGGITSHAAIICREMRIPCIVGCKGITRRLRNGDFVEVNATNGKVRIIER